jgi:DNA-binding LytR/AlgR family response regulator
MITNHQKLNNYVPDPSERDAVYIKFGKVHYRIQYDQIAYLYKIEGIFFLVDKRKLKLPIFMDELEDFPLILREDIFFRLSDKVIVNRTSVRIADGLDSCVAIAFNSLYQNKFKIPQQLETTFRFWLQKDAKYK